MKFLDLLRLSSSSLWKRKVRTAYRAGSDHWRGFYCSNGFPGVGAE